MREKTQHERQLRTLKSDLMDMKKAKVRVSNMANYYKLMSTNVGHWLAYLNTIMGLLLNMMSGLHEIITRYCNVFERDVLSIFPTLIYLGWESKSIFLLLMPMKGYCAGTSEFI